MTKMKEICLVERSDYHFPHICSSLVIGDVDGDGLEEIVAGSRDGDLLVFKLTCGRPYRKCSEPLGVISAMAVGDIFNANRPTLVVICADGRLNAYQLGANSFEVSFGSSFVQLLMPNIRAAFIKDIDGDGQEELIVGLTDRVVRSYR